MDKKSAEYDLHQRIYDAIFMWELDVFGEELKEKNKWKVKSGREAISVYLAKKYGWTIEHCQALSDKTLRAALADELASWKLPKELNYIHQPIGNFLRDNPIA